MEVGSAYVVWFALKLFTELCSQSSYSRIFYPEKQVNSNTHLIWSHAWLKLLQDLQSSAKRRLIVESVAVG